MMCWLAATATRLASPGCAGSTLGCDDARQGECVGVGVGVGVGGGLIKM